MFSDNMDARARRLIMPKNPEEVAKPSIGKVILALGRLDCMYKDIFHTFYSITLFKAEVIVPGLGILSQNLYGRRIVH